MDAIQLKTKFPNASADFILKNSAPLVTAAAILEKSAPARRLRQEHKPLLNKLELAWWNVLHAKHPEVKFRAQARRYKLANGLWYKPDITASMCNGFETAWEVKGPKAFRGGFEMIKTAAHEWPEVRWLMVWKEGVEWREQLILP